MGAPSRKTLGLHKNLRKAESAVLTEIRTGRIGLAAFFNKVWVPDYSSPSCRYGLAQETVTHVIAHCQLSEARRSLRDPRTGLVDIKSLVGTAEGVRRLTEWFIRLRILPQFDLGSELLYEKGEEEGVT